jgi:hypothetical protein
MAMYEKFAGINFNISGVSLFNTAMCFGGRPSHRHHNLKSVCAAISLDNTMTYIYIIHSTTLHHVNKHGLLYTTMGKNEYIDQ